MLADRGLVGRTLLVTFVTYPMGIAVNVQEEQLRPSDRRPVASGLSR
jgi:hypothetical protein